jgi:hypothetical protein
MKHEGNLEDLLAEDFPILSIFSTHALLLLLWSHTF